MKYYMVSEDELIHLANGKLNAKDIGNEKEIIYAITIADIEEEAKKLGKNPKKAVAIARERANTIMPTIDEIIDY
jgi:hypothetical protein